MNERLVSISRTTRETSINLSLNLSRREPIAIEMPLPFLSHLLNALAFHGGFSLAVNGIGDVEVDPHHLVEDVGLVLGDAFLRVVQEHGGVTRFGHSVIPMDDALSEVTIDACGRAYLVYEANFPQPKSGNFDMSLIREFLVAFANAARVNLHARCRYGLNGHHMAESLFKAMGKALTQGYTSADSKTPLSTKGVL